MKSKLFLSVILTGLFLSVYNKAQAQATDWLWAKSAGSIYNDMAHATATDKNGNSIVIGSYGAPITFGGTTLSLIGTNDIFIVKYDSSGNVVWAKSAGGSDNNYAYGIAVDTIGNSYITGYFSSPKLIFGNDTLVNPWPFGSNSFFIAKYDSYGNPVWATGAGGVSNTVTPPGEQAFGVAVDVYGNSYATGFFSDSILSFGNISVTKTGISGNDMFVVKFDVSGNPVWAKSAGGGGSDPTQGRAIAVDVSGNSYVTGYFRSIAIIFGNDTLYNGGVANTPQVFTVKYDAGGNEQWAKAGTGPKLEYGNGIVVDTAGMCVVTGSFGGSTITFDGTILTNADDSAGTQDWFVVKYDTSGTVAWAKAAGGLGDDVGNAIALDKSGNSYLSGQFRADTIAFGNTVITKLTPAEDIFVAKYDAAGTEAWAKAVGDSGIDIGRGIAVDGNDNIYATGWFRSYSIVIGSDTLINVQQAFSAQDMFIAKISACQTSSNVTVNACNIYLSPSGNYVWSVSGTYMDTIPNAAGCDSIMTINLIINSLSTSSTITAAACGSYTSPSGIYVWSASGVYHDTIPNMGGCDSVITINLTINNASSSAQTVTSCINYTSPSGNYIWNVSGVYLDTIANAAGCDSVITINLTVITVDTTITQAGNTLTANAVGAVYQWLDCNNGFAVIGGAISQVYTPVSIGNYAVEIIQNACVDTSYCYAVIGVGINEAGSGQQFNISPNPVSDILNVTINNHIANSIITISDMQGRVVKEEMITNSNSTVIPIDVSVLTQGVYLLRIDGVVERFVKL